VGQACIDDRHRLNAPDAASNARNYNLRSVLLGVVHS
jgi:hypothetical protein